MTQPGETDHYTVMDHIDAIHQQLGNHVLDFVIANQLEFSPQIIENMNQRAQSLCIMIRMN